MAKVVKLMSGGIEIIADSYINPRAYVLPVNNGFAIDQQSLRGDMVTLGADMRKAVKAYGKSANRGSRSK